MMFWRMRTPRRRPRRSCGTVSVLQAMVLCVATAAIVALVAMGNPLLLVAPVVAGLVSLVLGPRSGPADPGSAVEPA